MEIKSVRFVGSSLDDVRGFPAEARQRAGFELFAVQRSLEPTDWKAMPEIGPGVREIRLHVLGEWRLIYAVSIADAIYVLHAFQKQTRKTKRDDIELARKRLHQIGGR